VIVDDGMDEYLAARAEWDDRFAGQRKTVRVLTGITGAALFIGAAGAIFGMYATLNSRFIPYVVAVDSLGRAVSAPAPAKVGDWPSAVVKRELADFIDKIRTITPDIAVLRQNHDQAAAYLDRSEAAFQKLQTYFSQPANEPVARAATVTVAVDVTSVNYVGGSTWRVEWTETTFGRKDGKEISRKLYVATLIIAVRPVRTEELLRQNPLGLFITDLDIQEVRQ
jgi:type IV secretion system protein TrbF